MRVKNGIIQRLSWEMRLGIGLVLTSVLIYAFKFLVLGDLTGTYAFIFHALGFLPINVLLVTIILNRLLAHRSKQDKLQKMNMVIGAFFSETGMELLVRFAKADPDLPEIRQDLMGIDQYSRRDYENVQQKLQARNYRVDIRRIDIPYLRAFLQDKRYFLLRLLENPVLLEHDAFTDLMRAIFHLTEELGQRKNFEGLPPNDTNHLTNDIQRAYGMMILAWLSYMSYLNENYPYLFSLAVRMNPFDEKASVVVR
jgi:hypothetical protein